MKLDKEQKYVDVVAVLSLSLSVKADDANAGGDKLHDAGAHQVLGAIRECAAPGSEEPDNFDQLVDAGLDLVMVQPDEYPTICAFTLDEKVCLLDCVDEKIKARRALGKPTTVLESILKKLTPAATPHDDQEL